MFATILFTLVLNPQPLDPTSTPTPLPTAAVHSTFTAQLDRAEVVDSGDDVQMIAYDRQGAVIGSIALWAEPDGTVWTVSDYADGFSLVVVHPDGRVRLDGTLAPVLVEERAELVIASLDSSDPAQARWLSCAARTGVMIGTCATGNLFACPFSAVLAACECLPKLEPKWKNKSCS